MQSFHQELPLPPQTIGKFLHHIAPFPQHTFPLQQHPVVNQPPRVQPHPCPTPGGFPSTKGTCKLSLAKVLSLAEWSLTSLAPTSGNTWDEADEKDDDSQCGQIFPTVINFHLTPIGKGPWSRPKPTGNIPLYLDNDGFNLDYNGPCSFSILFTNWHDSGGWERVEVWVGISLLVCLGRTRIVIVAYYINRCNSHILNFTTTQFRYLSHQIYFQTIYYSLHFILHWVKIVSLWFAKSVSLLVSLFTYFAWGDPDTSWRSRTSAYFFIHIHWPLKQVH